MVIAQPSYFSSNNHGLVKYIRSLQTEASQPVLGASHNQRDSKLDLHEIEANGTQR